MEANNMAAMREAVRSILNLAYEVAAETEEPRCKISNDWLIETCKAALAAPTIDQEFIESPMDLNDHPIHIGDTVHMLNTGHDGDHEWDDVVLSLEYVGKGGGDEWLIHGKEGAAWGCECEVLKREGESDGGK